MVATLWDVNDAATATFMEQFYWHLGRGLTPAEALRQTKRRLRADPRWSRPALWAGYVLIGNPPAVAERRPPWIWILGAALAAVAILIGWRWGRSPRGRVGPGPENDESEGLDAGSPRE